MVCDVPLWKEKTNLDTQLQLFSSFLFSYVTGGKIGFYYKDHEILPPLPGWFFGFVLNYFEMVVWQHICQIFLAYIYTIT